MIMLRKDYIKLCQIAPEEFKAPYFFQTYDADPGYMKGFAKLINEETTSMTKAQAETFVPTHLGIWVDIFPTDNIVDDEKLFSKQKKAKSERPTMTLIARWPGQ